MEVKANNKIPLIGILMQTAPAGVGQIVNPHECYTFVAGSYVDWISQTGAIPVLIPFDLPKPRLAAILPLLQGFLIPGGCSDLGETAGHPTPIMLTIMSVLDYSKQMFEEMGILWPVMGICMGFQAIMMAYSDLKILKSGYDNRYKSHPVIIDEEKWKESKYFSKLAPSLLSRTLPSPNLYYWHTWAIDYPTLSLPEYTPIHNHLLILAHSCTGDNHDERKYVAMCEHRIYPVMGTQFHPEKTQFERLENNAFLDRSEDSVRFVSELAMMFVNIARKNPNMQDYKSYPDWLKPMFSFNMPIYNGNVNGNERIYALPKIYS